MSEKKAGKPAAEKCKHVWVVNAFNDCVCWRCGEKLPASENRKSVYESD